MGRRTLLLFVLSALVPVTVLASWAYVQVRDALMQRTQGRLEATAKELAVGIVERGLAIADLVVLVHERSSASDDRSALRGVRAWSTPVGHVDSLGQAARAHFDGGRPVLTRVGAAPGHVRFVRRLDRRAVWGEAPIGELVGFTADEYMDPSVCVIDLTTRRRLQCSVGADSIGDLDLLAAAESDTGQVIAAARAAFLRFEFGAGDWQVVTFRRRSDVLAAVTGIGRSFLLVSGLAILVVFFVSHMQIRRTTAPLEQLWHATRRIQEGELVAHVPADREDEFGDVARSFNAMSSELARQFGTLQALDAVDRAALSGSGRDAAIDRALQAITSDAAIEDAVVLIPPRQAGEVVPVYRHREPVRYVPVPHGIRPGCDHPGDNGDPVCEWLAHMGEAAQLPAGWRAIRLQHGAHVEGVILVASADPEAHLGDTWPGRPVVDRLAMALANHRLVTDLDDFARGTLTAFARAVDANSTWTAGHSERVTEGAVALGRHLGLSEPELDVLQRGGLLHDIGKIGVSASILDKPSRLTDEERAAIEMHPVIGHRILSPIPPMRDVLEIVRHHHERMDGTGYPDRLAGESIPLLARVLAVADVYDALVSDRPYRAGMRQDEALSLIRVMAGAHLDPVIVTHFLALKAEEALQGYRQTAGGFSPQELSPAPVGADA